MSSSILLYLSLETGSFSDPEACCLARLAGSQPPGLAALVLDRPPPCLTFTRCWSSKLAPCVCVAGTLPAGLCSTPRSCFLVHTLIVLLGASCLLRMQPSWERGHAASHVCAWQAGTASLSATPGPTSGALEKTVAIGLLLVEKHDLGQQRARSEACSRAGLIGFWAADSSRQ